jgi:DNA-binding SARP family transcriptional activator/nucleoid-associated protein YgaU
MIRAFAAARTTASVAIVLIGVPAALLRVGGPPAPHRLLHADAVQAFIRDPLSPPFVTVAALAAGWLMWAAFCTAVLLRLVALLPHTVLRRWPVRLPGPLQSLTAAILGAATISATPHGAATPPPPAAATDSTAIAGSPGTVTMHIGTRTHAISALDNNHPPGIRTTPTTTRPAADNHHTKARSAATTRPPAVTRDTTATVHRGDSLWKIAHRYLGNPHRWPEIFALNRGIHFPRVGGTLTDADVIHPGWTLKLPDDAAAPHPPTSSPAHRPRPPRPAPPAPSPAASVAPTTTASPRPPSPQGTAAATHDDTARPAHTPPVTPPASAPAPLHPTVGNPTETTAPHVGTAAGTSTAVTQASTPPPVRAALSPTPAAATTAIDTPSPRNTARAGNVPATTSVHQDGVDIGEHAWVALDVATAVSAAAALLWIHRRRRYRPQPVTRRRHDTDLTSLPTTVAALHHARTPAEDTTMDPRVPDLPEAATVTATALGAHPDHTPLRLPDLPTHGVGLTGPGALAASRGILAAVLSAGGPWACDTEATIITTRTDLHHILDGATAPELDRLHIVDDALREAEHQLLYRARTATAGDDLTTDDDPYPGLPATVILTAPPAGRRADRLAAILAIGNRLGITAVLTDAWPHGDTWTVDTNGTTTTADPTLRSPRLNVLDPTATAAVLDTLDQARPSTTDLPNAGPAPRLTSAPATQLPRTQPRPTTGNATSTPSPTPAPVAARPAPGPDSAIDDPAPARRTSDRPLLVTVLGRPSVEILTPGGRTELRVRRTDGVQILVHLAVDPGGATSDQLMAALWPEVRPRYARGRFHTTMSELRALLTDHIQTEAILRTGERYHLDPDQVNVDLWRLNDAIDRAAVTLDPAAHTAALHEVIGLYTGTIADGHSWLWLHPYREATRRHILDAYVALADTEPGPNAALAHIQDAIRLDPYNEDIYQRAMRLHAKLDSADGIRRALRALSERLTELEIRVSPQTQQIATELINRVDARHRIAGTAA